MKIVSVLFLMTLFLSMALPVAAQQQVVPEDFSSKQSRLFQNMTEAVSTPCCQNGLPVAFHDSGMAQFVRAEVIKWIRDGKDKDQILAELEAMRLGAKGDLPLIFTVPDNKLVSVLTWMVAPGVLGGGFLIVFLIALKKDKVQVDLSDDDLINTYRGFIMKQVGREENTQKV